MTVTITPPASEPAKKGSRLEGRGQTKNGVVEWGEWDKQPEATLTDTDRAAIHAAYEKINRNPNYTRASQVKTLMGHGNQLAMIQKALLPLGKGYGPDSIKRDFNALRYPNGGGALKHAKTG